jgi:molybdenum cofactor synthesis domain-containing protein
LETRVGILVVSDTRSSGERTDSSGPAAGEALALLGFANQKVSIVPDEIMPIKAALIEMSKDCRLIVTVGGTGYSPRDVTPEATAAVVEKRADSLCELMRLSTFQQTPYSYLSRGIAGVRGRTLIVNLPGSPTAVTECIEAAGYLFEKILMNLES